MCGAHGQPQLTFRIFLCLDACHHVRLTSQPQQQSASMHELVWEVDSGDAEACSQKCGCRGRLQQLQLHWPPVQLRVPYLQQGRSVNLNSV